MPKRGKRGRLMLSPNRVVAPVGGEVVMLAGLCGNDGYLVTGEPIEWMLTPESVGTFIQIAPDDANMLQRFTNKNEIEKVSGSFARGLTRTKPATITRGTLTTRDDVQLSAGQAWATISSPTEGVSRITALAPESDCWDQRKATTTIYWVDARWTFPAPQIAAAGSPVTLTTRVTRSEGTIPAVGWKVRYTNLTPELGGFAPSGSPVAEAVVDESGNAVATLIPNPGTAGTATIHMEVIRPAGIDDNIPALPLGSGQTIVTWNAPRLELKAGAPAVAGFDQPITVFANVSNPGNMATGKVDVSVELPPGVRFIESDFAVTQMGSNITWSYEEGIPAGVQADIALTVASRAPFQLQFTARDQANGLVANDIVRVNVSIPSMELKVRPADGLERITVGDTTKFLIDLLNTGTQPLENVQLEVAGDSGMNELNQGIATVFNTRNGPLESGETWQVAVDYNVFQPGQRCVVVTATADAQAPVTSQACVTAVNPVPVTPAVITDIAGLSRVSVGDTPLFRYFVQNTGRVPLTNILLTVTFPSQLDYVTSTEGNDKSQLGLYQVKWLIESLEPGKRIFVETLYNVVGPPGPAETFVTVSTAEGATAENDFRFEIDGRVAPPISQPRASDPVIPSGPAPRIPPNQPQPAPFNPGIGQTNPTQPSTQPPTQPQSQPPDVANEAGGLRLRVFDDDDPVLVGQDIRYRVQITNTGTRPDQQVQLRFALARDVDFISIQQTRFPDNQFDGVRGTGWYYIKEIKELPAGETIEYVLILRSDSPQLAGVRVQAFSLGNPNGVQWDEETRILPQ